MLGILHSNLCVPASLPHWQMNPFRNLDSSHCSLVASPSPVGCLPTAPTVKASIVSCLSSDGSFDSSKYMQYATVCSSCARWSILTAMTNTPGHSRSTAAQGVNWVTPVKIRIKKCRTNQQWERQRAKAGGGWRMAASKEHVNDQSHNGGQQATKAGGYHQVGRARNNQPSVGASKAWWQLAMRVRRQWLAIGDERGRSPSCDNVQQ